MEAADSATLAGPQGRTRIQASEPWHHQDSIFNVLGRGLGFAPVLEPRFLGRLLGGVTARALRVELQELALRVQLRAGTHT